MTPALDSLASRINLAHDACAASLRAGLAHALEAGRLLVEAKAAVGHGNWSAWLAAHVAFSERTAQGYMRVARHAPELAGDPQRVADLSLRGALAMLAEPKASPDHAAELERMRAEARAILDEIAPDSPVARTIAEEVARRASTILEAGRAVALVRTLRPDGFDAGTIMPGRRRSVEACLRLYEGRVALSDLDVYLGFVEAMKEDAD
jgi:hypothetical protein